MSGELQRFRSFLRGGAAAAASAGNDWEALCPELFALILKAVQQNAGREAGEARRVVALAGVCRRWRYLVQQSYSSPLAEIGLLQFPFSLRQPGPCNRPVHCLLKRKGSIFVLFQQQSAGGREGGDVNCSAEKLDFLMAARKQWKACGSCFVISASHTSFSKSGHAYMGKLRSDFWGADFNLWEAAGNYEKSKRLAVHISFSDRLQEGLRQRAMACELFTTPKRHPTSRQLIPAPPYTSNTRQCALQVLKMNHSPPNFFSCFAAPANSRRDVKHRAAPTFLRSYSSLRRTNYLERSHSKAAAQRVHSRELGLTEHRLVMESKVPRWDEQSQCLSLDFHGRATLPSHYSFQLVEAATAHDINNHSCQATELNDGGGSGGEAIIFLQLGKVGKGLYTVDFCHPLSAFQAFAICLSSFTTKVGLEP